MGKSKVLNVSPDFTWVCDCGHTRYVSEFDESVSECAYCKTSHLSKSFDKMILTMDILQRVYVQGWWVAC